MIKSFVAFVGMRRPDERHEEGRAETPDPYVPNVVRYQLRYIPLLDVMLLKIEL